MPELDGRQTFGGMRVDPSYFALLFALVVYTASHIAEIVRGSIQAVPRGQGEAADALGLGGFQRLWYVVLPQAFRIAIPPIGNQYLNLIKNSSLGAAIGYYDLTLVTQTAVGNGAPAVPAFAPPAWRIYIVISLITSAVRQHRQPPAGPGGAMSSRRRSGRRCASTWVRRNLFRSPLDAVLTVVFGALASTSSTGRWRSCS